MRWFFGRSRMVQRTCLACGETWTLEASEAHMHARGLPHGGYGKSLGVASQQVVRERVAESAAELDQEAETIRQLRTCPKCGGDRYKDRRVRTEIG
jgi:hypothetical protein